MWFNVDDDAMKAADQTYGDISNLVAGLTKEDTRFPGPAIHDPNRDLADNPDEPVFDAVFASSLIERLGCWSPPSEG